MAKKTRMGRNLNALLGGATRQRPTQAEAAPAADQAAPAGTTAVDDKTSESAVINPVSDSVVQPVASPAAIESAAAKPVSTVNNSQNSVAAVPADASAPSQSANDAASAPGNTNAASPMPVSATMTVDAGSSASQQLPPDSHPSDRLRMLGVDQITRGVYQPRRHFDQDLLQELADSIKAQGLIQPILVRAYGGKFELIAGERRWRASQLAGITDIPAIVREMDDQSVAAVSLIENIQRADLNPLEEAQALERLCSEFSMTHQQVAEAVGRSRAAVTNLMRLLELHDDVKGLVDDGELDMGHARALLGAPGAEQAAIAKRIVEQGLTVRAVEKLVKGLREGKPPAPSEPVKSDPNIEALGQKLGNRLGAPVKIHHQRNGSGKLEISYSSIDELEGILSHIK